jgi:peptidoglycan/LPS O-acetylase OafA/YrhL
VPTINPSTHNSELTHPKYRADIDGLRAVAILSVIGFHAFPNWITGGFIGVDIFFVISGFLISTIIVENLERNSFSFIEFYSRRIKRIFPALIVILIASFVIGWFVMLADELALLGKHIAAGGGFVSNIVLWRESGYFDVNAGLKPLLHLWSLGIEEQFYIVWPLLVWVFYRKRINVFGSLLALCLASFLLNVALVRMTPIATFYLPATRFWELLLGSTLAYLMLSHEEAIKKLRVWNGTFHALLGAVLIVVGVVFLTKTSVFPGWWALLPTIGAALIIAAGSQAWMNRYVLSHRVLVWFGLISFPLYLWHWLLLSFARIWEEQIPSPEIRVIAIVGSIALAWLTYTLIEKPIRFGQGRSNMIVTLFLLTVLIGIGGYTTYKLNGYPAREIFTSKGNTISADNIGEGLERTRDMFRACPIANEVSAVFQHFCLLHMNSGSKPLIVVWGDSHAISWLPVFKQIATQNNYELYVITTPGCPPIVGIRRTDGGMSKEVSCKNIETAKTMLDSIVKIKPDLVVLTARWSLYANGLLENEVLNPQTHFLTTDPTEVATQHSSKTALAEMIPKTLMLFKEKNIPVIVFKNPPILNDDIRNKRKSISEIQPTFREHIKFSKFTNDILDAINGLVVFDPATKICDEVCLAIINGKSLYRDENHLSEYGATYFQPEIIRLIKDNLNQKLLSANKQ